MCSLMKQPPVIPMGDRDLSGEVRLFMRPRVHTPDETKRSDGYCALMRMRKRSIR